MTDTEKFRPPSRNQLINMADGDTELMRAIEQLFKQTGQTVPTDLDVITADIEALQSRPDLLARSQTFLSTKQDLVRSLDTGQLVFVSDKFDFPPAVSGVITLEDSVTYYITSIVDLEGDRIEASINTSIDGGSPENCRLISTGLTGTALLTSTKSIILKNISFTADVALDLDATATANQAIDWLNVNFLNCPTIGTIKNYDNCIFNVLGILGSANLTFDGTIGTIGFDNTIFSGVTGETTIIIPSSAIITRRFRIIYSALIAGAASSSALDVSTSATIPVEGYILDTCNFAGSGTFITGVQFNDNKASFVNNVGISNSASVSNYHMNGNATATTITTINTPVKAAGITISNAITQRFTNTDNKAEYIGVIDRDFEVTVTASLISSNNVQMGLYIAKNGTIMSESLAVGTGNAGGRADSISTQAISAATITDFFEVYVENQSGTQNITVENLNVIVKVIS